jgi:hypothetical protein
MPGAEFVCVVVRAAKPLVASPCSESSLAAQSAAWAHAAQFKTRQSAVFVATTKRSNRKSSQFVGPRTARHAVRVLVVSQTWPRSNAGCQGRGVSSIIAPRQGSVLPNPSFQPTAFGGG